jgi:hypothetical protein
MRRFVEGIDRGQTTLFPECLEDWIDEDNPVRAIDAFVDKLDLSGVGFDGVAPPVTSLYFAATATTAIRSRFSIPTVIELSRLACIWSDRALWLKHRDTSITFSRHDGRDTAINHKNADDEAGWLFFDRPRPWEAAHHHCSA